MKNIMEKLLLLIIVLSIIILELRNKNLLSIKNVVINYKTHTVFNNIQCKINQYGHEC